SVVTPRKVERMSTNKPTLSRRRVLRSAAALGAVAGLPAWFAEETRAQQTKPATSPNDRPRLLLVGCGGRGLALVKEAKPFGDLVAVCDVDEKHVANAASEHPGVAEY